MKLEIAQRYLSYKKNPLHIAKKFPRSRSYGKGVINSPGKLTVGWALAHLETPNVELRDFLIKFDYI